MSLTPVLRRCSRLYVVARLLRVTLRDISPEVCRALTDAGLGYDFVVLEFGINAMSAGQTDYTSYGKLMAKVVEHIRELLSQCRDNAYGYRRPRTKIGARRSAPQRRLHMHMDAASARWRALPAFLFWDTREAIGTVPLCRGQELHRRQQRPTRTISTLTAMQEAVLETEFVKSIKMHSNPKIYIVCGYSKVSAGYCRGRTSSSRRRHYSTMMRHPHQSWKSITGRQSTTRKKSRYRVF